MENYGHIIAKVLLITLFSLLFSIMGILMKDIPETDVIKQHEKSLSMSTTTFFDRMDRWLELKSDQLYYVVKPLPNNVITLYSIMVSIILVLFMDITLGVGRSRTEEREKRRKSQI